MLFPHRKRPSVAQAASLRSVLFFMQSVAVFTDIKLNVLDSLSRKELLRLVTMVTRREGVNINLVHSRLLLGVHVAGVPSSIRRSISRQLICQHAANEI